MSRRNAFRAQRQNLYGMARLPCKGEKWQLASSPASALNGVSIGPRFDYLTAAKCHCNTESNSVVKIADETGPQLDPRR
jgi:hypothetical protein